MVTIRINLDDETVKRLDFLIAKGLYKNRTEAIQDQIEKGLVQLESVDSPDITAKHMEIIRELLTQPSPPPFLADKKSTEELVAEGRKR